MFVIVFCLIAHCLDAGDLKVSSPMSFKGLEEDGSFRFEGGVINLKERSVFLSRLDKKVFLPGDIKLIRDFVYSESTGVIAVHFEKKEMLKIMIKELLSQILIVFCIVSTLQIMTLLKELTELSNLGASQGPAPTCWPNVPSYSLLTRGT